MTKASITSFPVIKHTDGCNVKAINDLVAVEEPLEIIVEHGPLDQRVSETLAITMRTPGNDLDLVAGFLAAEKIIDNRDDIVSIRHCRGKEQEFLGNTVKVQLHPKTPFDKEQNLRHFYINSSCGVCGKVSVDSVLDSCQTQPGGGPLITPEIIKSLPAALLENQLVFNRTGGLHAAGIFDREGSALWCREDVGRHNAVDKVLGAAFRANRWPLDEYVLVVSGRVSYELVQKAYRSGIKFMASIGAPSSLAVDLAKRAGITLLGFVSTRGFNIYSKSHRVVDYVNGPNSTL
jgi:FdhD protein